MKKLLFSLIIPLLLIGLSSCGEQCLPDKHNGDVIIVTQQTLGAMDRATYNKMMDAAKANDNKATADMILAGQLRMVKKGLRGTLKDKDGTRALLLLPDDGKEWWVNANFLK